MDALEHFFSLGADCVGGSIILRHTELARLRDGQTILTDAGREALKTVKVGDVEVTPGPEKKSRKAKAAAAEDVEVKPVVLEDDPFNVDVQMDAD